MIAHRLSTVKNCDRLYLVKEGKVVDSGTYKELIQENLEFRQISI
jgi:ABC-type multidrug transport system fused ATPase/permease subunit